MISWFKHLPLFWQVALGNIMFTTLFMVMFIYQNHKIVKTQLSKLETSRIQTIIKRIEPSLTINLSLGLKQNYQETIHQLMEQNPELRYVRIENSTGETLLEMGTKPPNQNSTYQSFELMLDSSIDGEKLGKMVTLFSFTATLQDIIQEYYDFLILMLLVSLLFLGFGVEYIRRLMFPLKQLEQQMSTLNLEHSSPSTAITGSREIITIQEATREMLLRLQQESSKRIEHKKALIQKQRLASMGQMLDGIAHQWRQPLNTLSMILLNIDSKNETHTLESNYLSKKLNEADKLIAYLSQTIEDFRGYIHPCQTTDFYTPDELLQQAIRLLRIPTSWLQIIWKENSNQLCSCLPNSLVQAFLAILQNAREALETRQITSPLITITMYDDSSVFTCTIEDNAGGVDEKAITEIFNPYFSTKTGNGGSGLGLYISKIIIEEIQGGTLCVDNTDRGARFTITFPCAKT